MSRNKGHIYAGIAVVFVVFSTAAFLLPFERNAVFWLSYLFGVLAIGVQAIVFCTLAVKGEKIKSRFYGFPIAVISVVYLIIQIACSLLFFALSSSVPINLAVIILVIISGAVAVGLIAADVMRTEIEHQEEHLEKDVRCIQELRVKTAAFPGLCDDNAMKHRMRELAEKFQYSDPVSSDFTRDVENNLTVLTEELQTMLIDGEASGAEAMCKKIADLLDERNRLCKLNKGK